MTPGKIFASSNRAETAAFLVIVDTSFLVVLGHYCGRAPALCTQHLILSPKNLISGRQTKTEWLIVNVTAIASPTRAESEVFWTDFDIFGRVGPFLWSEGHL